MPSIIPFWACNNNLRKLDILCKWPIYQKSCAPTFAWNSPQVRRHYLLSGYFHSHLHTYLHQLFTYSKAIRPKLGATEILQDGQPHLACTLQNTATFPEWLQYNHVFYIPWLQLPYGQLRVFKLLTVPSKNFCIWQSPTGFHGVLMESSQSRHNLLKVLMESSWSPWSLWRLHVESS